MSRRLVNIRRIGDRVAYVDSVTGRQHVLSREAAREAALALAVAASSEPAPEASSGDVWAEVIIHYVTEAEHDETVVEWMRARREFGIAKYGTPLQRDNGRDPVADLRDELLDGCAYALAAGNHDILQRLFEALETLTN